MPARESWAMGWWGRGIWAGDSAKTALEPPRVSQPGEPYHLIYLFYLMWWPWPSEVEQRLQNIPLSCAREQGVRELKFRETQWLSEVQVPSREAQSLKVLWVKQPGNRAGATLIASASRAWGFLQKRAEFYLYWLPNTWDKPVSKQLHVCVDLTFFGCETKIFFSKTKKKGGGGGGLSEPPKLYFCFKNG